MEDISQKLFLKLFKSKIISKKYFVITFCNYKFWKNDGMENIFIKYNYNNNYIFF